jgi:hypothetical protein
MIKDMTNVSVKSYLRFCFFLLAFLGSSTVNIEREARANICEILDAREKIPTSVKPPEIFATALLIVGQLSAIICDTPAGYALFIRFLIPCRVNLNLINFLDRGINKALAAIDKEKIATEWVKLGL